MLNHSNGPFRICFLIVSVPLCIAQGETHAQETVEPSNEVSAKVAADSGRSLEAAAEGNPPETKLANNPKNKPTLLEEFFSSPLNFVLVLVVCFYVYLMFMQPRNARHERKLQAERLDNLKKNDRVVTTSGIHGIVSNINTDAKTVTLRVDESSNAKITIDRDSIRSVAS